MDPLARLRIIKRGVLSADFVLNLEITSVRSIPVALQGHLTGSIIHFSLRSAQPSSEGGALVLGSTLPRVNAYHSSPLFATRKSGDELPDNV
jgi:hypothetical protein